MKLKPMSLARLLIVVSVLNLPSMSFAEIRIDSVWTTRAVTIDGVANQDEWWPVRISLEIPQGHVKFQNDDEWFYLLIDLTGDTGDDPPRTGPPWGDFISLTFDVNGDGQITPNVDASYELYPGTHRLGRRYYLAPGTTTGGEATQGSCAAAFGQSRASSTPHRLWEAAIPLKEIQGRAGGAVRLGIQAHSETPQINAYEPPNLTRDFSELVRVNLAQSLTVRVVPAEIAPIRVTTILPNPASPRSSEPPQTGGRAGIDLFGPHPTKRVINADGSLEVHFSDGTIEKRYLDRKTVHVDAAGDASPNRGKTDTAAPAAIPPSLPAGIELDWLEAHSKVLLTIISQLIEYDEQQLANYLAFEGEGVSLYDKIVKRSGTIRYLTSP